MFDMKQILVRLSPGLARSLERVAPGRGRKRSEFIRDAILKAIWAAEEVHTEAAYRKWPQEPLPFDPSVWAPESEAIHFSDEEVSSMMRAAAAREDACGPETPKATRRPRVRKTAGAPGATVRARTSARGAKRKRGERRR